MEFLSELMDPDLIRNALGEAAASEFGRTCFIFSLAAFVHARQVRREIKTQFSELVQVLKADLTAQQEVLGKLGTRVDKIESHLHIKGD